MGKFQFSLLDLPARYAFLDPAGGKKRSSPLKNAARSAIVVAAPSPVGHILVLEAWAAKCTTSELVEKVFATQKTWGVRVFGVEANAMQSLFVDSLELLAQFQEVRLPLTPVFQPTRVEKEFRIRTALQPLLQGGRLVLGTGQTDLLVELEAFPQGQTVDLVDALASVVRLIPPFPEAGTLLQEERGLENYLRSINTPAWYIQQKLEELRGENQERSY